MTVTYPTTGQRDATVRFAPDTDYTLTLDGPRETSTQSFLTLQDVLVRAHPVGDHPGSITSVRQQLRALRMRTVTPALFPATEATA